MPWRATRDPYAIWVSEVMLQQTQVATVLDYYRRWMERFPTAEALAEATEEDALSVWQGLGYYRRCRLLQSGACQVAATGMPRNRDELLKVPGIGKYTAAAIASIAFEEPVPLVDGNVERVFARLEADPTTKPALNAKAWAWAEKVLATQSPGEWNQALMELGATVCTPREPKCNACPVQAYCSAYKQQAVDEYPKKVAKQKPTLMHHVTVIPVYKGRVGVRLIPEGQWWQRMYEFARVDQADEQSLFEHLGNPWTQTVGHFSHAVTRYRIRMTVLMAMCEQRPEGFEMKTLAELGRLPLPSPQRKALQMARPFMAESLSNAQGKGPG
ncbi:MAG: A/G-specific adenine glycosylase [Fimbriimonadaceae bacterium]